GREFDPQISTTEVRSMHELALKTLRESLKLHGRPEISDSQRNWRTVTHLMTEQQQRFATLYFDDSLSYDKVKEELGVSKGRVSALMRELQTVFDRSEFMTGEKSEGIRNRFFPMLPARMQDLLRHLYIEQESYTEAASAVIPSISTKEATRIENEAFRLLALYQEAGAYVPDNPWEEFIDQLESDEKAVIQGLYLERYTRAELIKILRIGKPRFDRLKADALSKLESLVTQVAS
ncbi:MAG: hypothetical protein KDD53_11405, partial [Bdellovibrionales bacterium]|nr:hypothetical protein [Bdellovibrionales bacterium]